MDEFEMYLTKRLSYLNDMLAIFENSKDDTNKETIRILYQKIDLLKDIIHHFGLFVKGEEYGS